MQATRSVELFAGAGGLLLGAHQAGFTCELAIDVNADATTTLRRNASLLSVAPDRVITGDVAAYRWDDVPGEVDVVFGGPPCQPFSIGGSSRAAEDPRDMFPVAVDVVRHLHPKMFMFENVKGLTRPRFAEYLTYIIGQLERPRCERSARESWHDHARRLAIKSTELPQDSYRVQQVVLNAADFGSPQHRHRVFLVGVRNDITSSWTPPQPTHHKNQLMYDQWVSGDYWHRHDLRPPRTPLSAAALDRVVNWYDSTPDTLPWTTVRDAFTKLPPFGSAEAAAMNHLRQPGAVSYPGHTGSVWDAPSKALKAGAHGVPGGENMVRHANGKVRYFTLREALRVQDFPDDFLITGSEVVIRP